MLCKDLTALALPGQDCRIREQGVPSAGARTAPSRAPDSRVLSWFD